MTGEHLLERVRQRLRDPPSCGVPAVDRLVVDALRPGKLLRPDLVIRSAAAAPRPHGPDPKTDRQVVEAALSMELLHVATLVHDDIIDGSSTRRGRPSVVASAGVATAIVVGDLLLARGAIAAASSAATGAEVWARALECMAAGQLREAGLTAAPSIEAHAEYAGLKTAELFRASAEIGALAAGAAPDVVDAHGKFGVHFGLAFQYLDDLLDAIGDPRRMGKPVGVDASNGVPTAVSLLPESGMLEEVTGLVGAELDAARRAPPPGRTADELGAWGAVALRRALHSAVGEVHHPGIARLFATFTRLDLDPDSDLHQPKDLHLCPTSSTA